MNSWAEKTNAEWMEHALEVQGTLGSKGVFVVRWYLSVVFFF